MTTPTPGEVNVSGAPAADPPDTGFRKLRARWLGLWLVGMLVLSAGLLLVLDQLSIPDGISQELLAGVGTGTFGVWAYTAMRRNGINIRVLFARPNLGKRWWLVVGLTLALLVLSTATSSLTSLLLPELSEVSGYQGVAFAPLSFLVLVIVAPFSEELAFRGALVERWTVKWRIPVAVTVSSIVFGLGHADVIGSGLFGVVMAILYLQSGSLWPAITAHAANNAIAFLALLTFPDSATGTPELSEVLIVAGVGLALGGPPVVWFIMRNWPVLSQRTPYELYESDRYGWEPMRRTRPLTWSRGPGKVYLWIRTGWLQVTADRKGSQVLAALDLRRLRAVYPSSAGGGHVVVLLTDDGTQTRFSVGRRRKLASALTTEILGRRAELPGGNSPRLTGPTVSSLPPAS